MTTKTSNSGECRGVSFTLLGDPVAAPRPRIRVLRLKNGKTMGTAYYSGKYKEYLVEAPKAIPESELFFDKGTPLTVSITFYCKKPQKPANPYPKADIDNYCKSILDAIGKNGTYWKDDVQVVSLLAHKRYTVGDPRTEVHITEA